jgi:hypothetical protein
MPLRRLSPTAFAGAFALASVALAGSAQAQAPAKKAEQSKIAKQTPATKHKVAIQVNQNDNTTRQRARPLLSRS